MQRRVTMSAEKGDQWRIQHFSEGGAYGQARYEKRGGGGGGAVRFSSFIVAFRCFAAKL